MKREAMKCEGCGNPINELRLVKWQEWNTLEKRIITHRLWLCLTCWLEHGGEIEARWIHIVPQCNWDDEDEE